MKPRLFALMLLLPCAHPAYDHPSSEPGSWEGHPYDGCKIEPGKNCGAGGLPRVTERDWRPEEVRQFLKRSQAGTVAVDRGDHGTGTRVAADCRLDGGYTEVRGEAGSGRFWATERPFFRYAELTPSCQTATHVVAAFVVERESGSVDAGSPAPPRFAAILVPLPCPPTADERPAPGCLGKGLTGPRRLEKALAMRKTVPPDEAYDHDVAYLFEVYALMAGDPRAYDYLLRMQDGRADCYLKGQVLSASGRDDPSHWPKFVPTGGDTCRGQPPFMGCFPGLFDPAGGDGCWQPAGPR